MVARVAILILLGTTLALAAPDQYGVYKATKTHHKLTKAEKQSIEEGWQQLKITCSGTINKILDTWEKIKRETKGEHLNLKPIEDIALLAVRKTKELYGIIKTEDIVPKSRVNEIKTLLKKLATDLQKTSRKAYEIAKKYFADIVVDVQLKLKVVERLAQ